MQTMNPKSILCLALVLSGGAYSGTRADPVVTNRLSDGATVSRFPPLQIVNSILFSTDGKTVATLRGKHTFWHEWSKPLTLQAWAVSGGTLLWTAKESAFRLLSFSPDNSLLAGISGDGNLAIWNTADGRLESHFPRMQGSVVGALFLPNGRTLVVAVNLMGHVIQTFGSGVIQVRDAESGRRIRTLKAQTNVISAMTISPDGKRLAVASEDAGVSGVDTKINVIDLGADSLLRTLRLGTNVWTISSLAFSPDGRTLVAGGGHHDGSGEIMFWDVASGKLLRILTDAGLGSAGPRISMEPLVAFSPDGETLVSVGDNQTMLWWNVKTGKWRGDVEGSVPPQPGRYTVHFDRKDLLSAKVNSLEQVEIQRWHY